MMLQFYTNNLITRYIQALLTETWLPVTKCVVPGDYLIKGQLYTTKNHIIKCKESGIYGNAALNPDLLTSASCEILQEYHPGRYYPRSTESFYPTSNTYDSLTHEWLGKFLRHYKTTTGIDLLPFYNCYSDTYLNNVIISKDSVDSYITSEYKVARIPIEFNKTYTIAIDCTATVWIAPVFLSHDNFLILKNASPDGTEDRFITNEFIESHSNVIRNYPGCSFNQPVNYRLDMLEEKYGKYEKNLYLLILLPAINRSSIVVLEGDYTFMNAQESIVNAEYLDTGEISDLNLNSSFLNKLSLLMMNDNIMHPFSNRLVEYLFNNVIASFDEYANDISTVQDLLPTKITSMYVRGAWNLYTRYKIYLQLMLNTKLPKLDQNGFVDKDTESLFL